MLFLIFLAVHGYVRAQSIGCGFETSRQWQPDYKTTENRLNETLYQKAIASTRLHRAFPAIVYVPVVVHIIHQNGPENLSDSVVIAGINELNLRFQNASPYSDSSGTPMDIQFCLASLDPLGNPTTGITHDTSALTYLWGGSDLQMKNINRWDPYYYYNIWVVHSIFGFNISVSGYASLPSNLGDGTDGVVITYTSISGSVLTHESGHFLGLYHTWQGGCTNFNCLMDGDGVCDTPPDTSTTTCMGNSCASEMNDTSGFNSFTSDVNDLPNYMDYTPCPLSFTQGQADRMNNSLASIRYQLLQSAGCGFAGGPIPVAQVGYFISPCNTGEVQFSDSLSTYTNTVNWDFNNDGIYDSYQHNPVYTYPTTGSYTVKLKVAGPGGVDSVYQTIFVQKAPSLYFPITSYGGVYTNSQGQLASCPGYTNNLIAAPAVSYLWSTGETTQTISYTDSTSYTITLTIVDSAGLTWSNQLCNPFTVIVYPLPPTALIYSNDSLSNCVGDVVTFHSGLNVDSSYVFNWYENSQALNIHDSVLTVTGSGPNTYYQLIIGDTNGCFTWSNILYLNSYAPPAIQSLTQNGLQLSSGWGNGNQWYLNGVAIPGANGMNYLVNQIGCYQVAWFINFAPDCITLSDSICFVSLIINEQTAEQSLFSVFPIPAHDNLSLKINPLLSGAPYAVTDPVGRLVVSGILESNRTSIDISWLTNGIYFIFVSDMRTITPLKIVKE